MTSNLVPFYIAVSASLISLIIMAGWAVRSTSVSPTWKVIVPVVGVALSLWAPNEIRHVMGLPLETTVAALPDDVELLFFVPVNRSVVDVWLRESDGLDRVYRVEATPAFSELLSSLSDRLYIGNSVRITKNSASKKSLNQKNGKKPNSHQYNLDDPGYVIIDDTPRLPPKQ